MANLENLSREELERAQEKLTEIRVPSLEGRHSPSTTALSDLKPIAFQDLQKHVHHCGRVLYFIVSKFNFMDGMNIKGIDLFGTQVLVWSLVEYPLLGGKASIRAGTVLAVKEPYCISSVYDKVVVHVHHPSDLVRLSEFMISSSVEKAVELLKAGDAALISGRLMDAVDLYSEGIRKAQDTTDNPSDPSNDYLATLLVKRAFAYSRLQLNEQAMTDATEVLKYKSDHVTALRLVCRVASSLGNYGAAQNSAQDLLAIADTKENREISAKVTEREQQAAGKFDFGKLAKSNAALDMNLDVTNFIGDVEIRKSSLGGRGVFAKHKLTRGQILVCEKPLAISMDETTSSYNLGLGGLMKVGNGYCAQGSMSFLQQLVSAAVTDPLVASKLFDLFDGEISGEPNGVSTVNNVGFDSYKAMDIMQYNHQLVDRRSACVIYDLLDPNLSDDVLAKYVKMGEAVLAGSASYNTLTARAICYMGSLFNHSCLPNAIYNRIGDLMMFTAGTDVEAGQELLLSYVEAAIPYAERQENLSKYNITCTCPLCKIEKTMSKEGTVQRELMNKRKRNVVAFVQQTNVPKTIAFKTLEDMVKATLRTYSRELSKGLPCQGMMEAAYRTAHAFIGPVEDWSKATTLDRAKGSDYFHATLKYGQGISIIQDLTSPYCELAFSKHAQQHPFGILALVALAEIAYLAPKNAERERALPLLRCAKEYYKLYYSEDATFNDHHKKYKCMALATKVDTAKPPEDWPEKKAVAKEVPFFSKLM